MDINFKPTSAEEVLHDYVRNIQLHDKADWENPEGVIPRFRCDVHYTLTAGPEGGHFKGYIQYDSLLSERLNFYGTADYNFGVAAAVAIKHEGAWAIDYDSLVDREFNYDGHGVLPGFGYAQIYIDGEWVFAEALGSIVASVGPWFSRGKGKFTKG